MWVGNLLLAAVCAKVFVLGPESLQSTLSKLLDAGEGVVEVPSTLANFGNPPYGSQLVGKAFYSDKIGLACEPLEHIDIAKEDGIPILLADRGECPFVMKARFAQDAGYKALVVVDLRDEALEEIIMSDNGTGGNIFIPVMMISKSVGEALKNVAKDDSQHVELKLTFDVDKRTRVHLRIVYSADNEKAANFFTEFAPYAKNFNKTNLNFRPHFALWYCAECAVGNYTKSNIDCIAGGRYCAPDPDGIGKMTGKDIMMEDLREICLLQKTSDLEARYGLWFEYMSRFNSACRAKDITEECSYKILGSLGISTSLIDQCIKSSVKGTNIDIDDNDLMRKEVRAWMNLGLEFYPAILINNRTYRGDWEGLQLTQTICAGYLTPPEFCASVIYSDTDAESTRTSLTTVLLMIALSLAVIIIVLVIYRAWVKREMKLEMRQQVNLAMSQYYALSSEGSQLADRSVGRRK